MSSTWESRERAAGPRSKSLPRRLDALLALTGEMRRLADVGTDHALLPAHAVLRGLCQHAVGVDLREQPLRAASETLSLLGVSDRVTLLRGDGLAALRQTTVDVVTLAGLSGRTLIAWCRGAPDVVGRLRRLVVQPNGHLRELRAWAYQSGMWLVDENICRERDRFFVSCAFAPATGPDPAYEGIGLALEHAFELGPWLLRRRDVESRESFAREHRRLQKLAAAGREQHRDRLAAYEAARHLIA